MYRSYFSLSGLPFECNLDQRFLYLSESHKEVLAAILYFISERKGFALVCGDVGTGKTMLVNQLLNRLSKDVHAIRLGIPDTDHTEFLPYIGRSLGIQDVNKNALELFNDVKSALIEANRKDKQVVLIIDEAHLLPNRSLEHIRILSNIETTQSKLLQILLVGQYELSAKLDLPEMRPLRQRININRFLMPMSAVETIAYIGHRLELVDSNYEACFESGCERLIWRLTSGVPRRINQLCDNALLICKVENKRKVNRKILKWADEALRTDRMCKPGSKGEKAARRFWGYPVKAFLASLCVLALLTMWSLADDGRLGNDAQRVSLQMKAEVSKSYRAICDRVWAARVDKTFPAVGAVRDVANPGGVKDDPSQKKVAGIVSAQAGKSLRVDTDRRQQSGTEPNLVEVLQVNAGLQPTPGPSRVEPMPSPIKGQPADAPVSRGRSEQRDSSNSLLGDVRTALPRSVVVESRVSDTPALIRLHAKDGKKGGDDAKPLRREEVSPVSQLSREDGSTNQTDVRSEVPSQNNVSVSAGVVGPFDEEGKKDPQLIPREIIRESAGQSDSPADGREAGAESGDKMALRQLQIAEDVRHVIVKKGDTLLKIAADQYPRNPEWGYKAIVHANPAITNPNQIFPGQTIALPGLGLTPGVRFVDSQYFADYGRYGSLEDLRRAMLPLARNTIRFLITRLNDSRGEHVYLITLGGYDRLPDLVKAMEILKANVERNRTSG